MGTVRTLRTLFSGGELFGVGARQAGWRHVDGFEINPKITAVAQRNSFDVHTADVCDVDYVSLPTADHLHASPSCKNASQANTDAGEAPEDLACADAVCRAIAAHQGDTFSLENVWAYRNFESFARILAALQRSGFLYDYDHINAADYGVPQTRKRLILRAVRGRDRAPTLHPTHRQGGDMFYPPWVGWYAAIEDLIDTLPETKPAPWQLARMPDELKTMLVAQGAFGDRLSPADHQEPAFTTTANSNQNHLRAYIVEGTGAADDRLVTVRNSDEPMWTLRAQNRSDFARAYLIGGGNTGFEKVTSHARTHGEPAFTVRDGSNGSPERAYLIDGDNGRVGSGEPTQRAADEPAMTLRGSRTTAHRAYVGRWVRMTVQALGRFQTVPDDYQGLTAEINGNGVPCLLAQRIMETF